MSKELAVGINGSGKKLQSRIWFFSLVEEENDIPTINENLKSCSAENVFTIRHDKDKIRQDDGSVIPKRVHWHYALRFNSPMALSTIANIFGLQVCDYNLIQKAKNWRASCRYMLHLDQKDKHLYDIKELVVLKGAKDDYYNVAIGKAQVVTSDADLFPDFADFDKKTYKEQYKEIFENISDTKRRNILVKELKTSFDNYIEFRRVQMETKKVNVLFVEGATGSGKSTFATMLAINNKKTYCVSSSSNDVLQDYTCEDYLILDDLRDTAFSFEDLLKLLDNYVISSVKSRYKNKLFLGEMIIITSAVPLSEWYKNSSEDLQQLYRRINMFARCQRNGNSLIANVYVPMPGVSAVNDKGLPNGVAVPTPIIDLTPQMVQSVEDCWKQLGINIEDVFEPVAKNIIDYIDEKEVNNN